MDRWAEVELFVQAVEHGSLSRAAECLSISNATASRKLAALEHRLNARLIDRSSRRFVLTEVGEAFYQRSKAILAEMREAEDAVNAVSSRPSGTLRVTSSLSFCMTQLVPLLSSFAAVYPDIDVQLIAANRYLDLIDAGIDVAIRTREYEADSGMTVRPLAQTRRILAAAPSYLRKRGGPPGIDDLASHRFLVYSYALHPYVLHLSRGAVTRRIKLRPSLEANDAALLRAAALDGQGILVQSLYSIYDDVAAGRLVPLLEDWDLPRLSINIAYQSRKYLPAKTRAFIDFLTCHFAHMDYERKWTMAKMAPGRP
ncbi:MAG: LysR substrate-binding domain-containing protein [Pigmentiphaga sp.]|uniref:LysR family transcriptional regulator n=1 Tax=Pigmentiphaga sp. TaxID=1977564 RepID=UPI0029A598A2|nr:LysR substrate-binding domain-containing protein [Pigmentiphaga sp.]MDX3906572.1 LysR substrate-binding domain-containing protein [Pigmentiphaga sp.]